MGRLPVFTGQDGWQTLEQLRPLYQLSFYPQSVILRKENASGSICEYPVDPAQVAAVLAAKVEFSTGLLPRDVLYVGQSGAQRVVAGYRKPQVTGLWLEGSEAPLHIPLPGLLLLRSASNGGSASYQLFAVKGRPKTLQAKLYAAPLPNVGAGGLCWGTVLLPTAEQLQGTSLDADWKAFLGSRFGSHSVHDKSKKHARDLRALYLELEGQQQYPLADLVATNYRLEDILKGKA